MLLFFPGLKPDELLYSAASRYHFTGGGVSHETTTKELTGIRSCHMSRCYPSRLQYFCDQLPGKVHIDPEVIINKHTLFPLYRPFLPPARAQKIQKAMIGKAKGGEIIRQIGSTPSRTPHLNYLRCCPVCIEQDNKKYGFSYWNRNHQIYGNFVCHKHHTILLNTIIPFQDRTNGYGYNLLTKDLITSPVTDLIINENEHKLLIWISEQFYWIINNNLPSIGPCEINKRLKNLFYDKGLANVRGHFLQKEIDECFHDFFDNKITNMLGYNQASGSYGLTWLRYFLRNKKSTTHPLMLLLVLRMLGVTAKELFHTQGHPILPFGEGPWPCLNVLSKHYKQDVITTISITQKKAENSVTGKFYCECGFSYSRKGPDKNSSDRYEYSHVIRYGHTWKMELIAQFKTGKFSMSEILEKTKASKDTITRTIDKTNNNNEPELEFSWRHDTILGKRGEWLEIVKNNQSLTRTELRHNYKTIFVWLARNDRDWFKQNLPKKMVPKGSHSPRVDWPQRDNSLANKVERIVTIVKSISPPQKISKRVIFEHLGISSGLVSPAKLPLLCQKIDQHTESLSEFQIRRTQYVAQKLNNEGKLTRYNLIKKASLYRFTHLPEIRDEIERVLGKYNSPQ